MKILIKKISFLVLFVFLISTRRAIQSTYYTPSTFENANNFAAKYIQPTLAYGKQQAQPALQYVNPAIKYAKYFGAGFLTQAGLNQTLGFAKIRSDLPTLSQQQIAVLTATGSAFATLPLLMTLSTAAGLGVLSVVETMKGGTEASVKDKVARQIDIEYARTISEDTKRQDFTTKAYYDRLKAKVSSQESAAAVAKSGLLIRALVVGATALSILGPTALDYFKSDSDEENYSIEPIIPLTPEEENRQRLKRIEAKLYASPLDAITKIRLEQMSFFAGQLAASAIPNTLGMKYWNQFKNWRKSLSKN